MELLIDYRERKVAHLIEDVCSETRIIDLPLGDYLIASEKGSVIVERKSIHDFISSVRSNRLWDQLLRLMKTEEVLGYRIRRTILLIQGSVEEYFKSIAGYSIRDTDVFWSQIIGAFLEVLYVYNTPIIFIEKDEELRPFFKTLIRREETGLNDKLPEAKWYRKRVRAELPTKDRKRYILSSIPFIGEVLARNLLEHFGTISNVANASVDELQEVPKIGKKKSQIIYEMFH